MSRNKEHRPHGAAAEGGRPIWAPPKAAPVCLMEKFIDIYGYIINICGCISYTFLIYSIYIYIFPRYVPCIFPCVFLNLWSQEKTSPYRKTTFYFYFSDFIHFIFLLILL